MFSIIDCSLVVRMFMERGHVVYLDALMLVLAAPALRVAFLETAPALGLGGGYGLS